MQQIIYDADGGSQITIAIASRWITPDKRNRLREPPWTLPRRRGTEFQLQADS